MQVNFHQFGDQGPSHCCGHKMQANLPYSSNQMNAPTRIGSLPQSNVKFQAGNLPQLGYSQPECHLVSASVGVTPLAQPDRHVQATKYYSNYRSINYQLNI